MSCVTQIAPQVALVLASLPSSRGVKAEPSSILALTEPVDAVVEGEQS